MSAHFQWVSDCQELVGGPTTTGCGWDRKGAEVFLGENARPLPPTLLSPKFYIRTYSPSPGKRCWARGASGGNLWHGQMQKIRLPSYSWPGHSSCLPSLHGSDIPVNTSTCLSSVKRSCQSTGSSCGLSIP